MGHRMTPREKLIANLRRISCDITDPVERRLVVAAEILSDSLGENSELSLYASWFEPCSVTGSVTSELIVSALEEAFPSASKATPGCP